MCGARGDWARKEGCVGVKTYKVVSEGGEDDDARDLARQLSRGGREVRQLRSNDCSVCECT